MQKVRVCRVTNKLAGLGEATWLVIRAQPQYSYDTLHDRVDPKTVSNTPREMLASGWCSRSVTRRMKFMGLGRGLSNYQQQLWV